MGEIVLPSALSRDILPDSRLKPVQTPKGGICGPNGWWVPMFCANCFTPAGFCPQESTHVFYLCDDCVDKHGVPAGMMAVPDEVFWETVKQEQIDKYGRLLSEAELIRVLEDGASPLATLLKSGQGG